jgi:NADH-quinone oxidoreductase subunit H
MQFNWLILIPVTLGNILLTGMVYLLVSGLGFSNLVFLIVIGTLNWALLIGFIWLVRRATVASTRKAQGPMLHAKERALAAPVPKALESLP